MWLALLTEPKTLAALAGAALGAARAITSSPKRETWPQMLLAVACGQVLAAAVVEHFALAVTFWPAAFVGVVCGSVGGYALDALTALTPKALHSLVSMLLGKAGAAPIEMDTKKHNEEDAK